MAAAAPSAELDEHRPPAVRLGKSGEDGTTQQSVDPFFVGYADASSGEPEGRSAAHARESDVASMGRDLPSTPEPPPWHSPPGPGDRRPSMTGAEMREWHLHQQYYEDRIRTLSQFPVALVATGLILIYFADILRSLAIAALLWLIFSPMIELLSEPCYYPVQALLCLAGARTLRSGAPSARDVDGARCRYLLSTADIIARIKVPRVLCVLLVLVFVGFCFWLLIAKTFTSISGLLRDSDNLLTMLSAKVDELRGMIDQSMLADTVDWDAVIRQMVSHARELTTQDSIEQGIWWLLNLIRVSLGNFFLVFLMFMFLTLVGEFRYPSTQGNHPKSEQVLVVEKYLYAQTFLSLLTAGVNGTIYGYLHVPASFIFALMTFWLNFIPVIGSIIAVLLPMPLVLVVLDFHDCLMALILPTITQLLIGNTLYPVLMGRTMLLHPVTILVGMSMCARARACAAPADAPSSTRERESRRPKRARGARAPHAQVWHGVVHPGHDPLRAHPRRAQVLLRRDGPPVRAGVRVRARGQRDQGHRGVGARAQAAHERHHHVAPREPRRAARLQGATQHVLCALARAHARTSTQRGGMRGGSQARVLAVARARGWRWQGVDARAHKPAHLGSPIAARRAPACMPHAALPRSFHVSAPDLDAHIHNSGGGAGGGAGSGYSRLRDHR